MQGITEASIEWNSDTTQPPRILVINHLKRDFVLSLQTFANQLYINHIIGVFFKEQLCLFFSVLLMLYTNMEAERYSVILSTFLIV